MMTKSFVYTLKDLQDIPQRNVNVFSTFAGGGGSSIGYKLAGCTVLAANDIDPMMARHYKRNLKVKHFFECPIKNLLKIDLPDELYGIDILDGSPPCSTFSIAGSREKAWMKEKKFREGQAKQVLSELFFDFIALARKIRPKVIVAENVKGIIIGKAKGYAKAIAEEIKSIGYQVQVFLINAADCGVPQRRERVFFCAARNDLNVLPLSLSFNEKWITTEEAISDIQLSDEEKKWTEITPYFTKIWKQVLPGQDFAAYFEKYGKAKLFNHVKVSPKVSCNTIAARNTIYHWNEPRRFSFQELKRLGSFPDDYQAESFSRGSYIVGMSVPPRMIQKLADQICTQWLHR